MILYIRQLTVFDCGFLLMLTVCEQPMEALCYSCCPTGWEMINGTCLAQETSKSEEIKSVALTIVKLC